MALAGFRKQLSEMVDEVQEHEEKLGRSHSASVIMQKGLQAMQEVTHKSQAQQKRINFYEQAIDVLNESNRDIDKYKIEHCEQIIKNVSSLLDEVENYIRKIDSGKIQEHPLTKPEIDEIRNLTKEIVIFTSQSAKEQHPLALFVRTLFEERLGDSNKNNALAMYASLKKKYPSFNYDEAKNNKILFKVAGVPNTFWREKTKLNDVQQADEKSFEVVVSRQHRKAIAEHQVKCFSQGKKFGK